MPGYEGQKKKVMVKPQLRGLLASSIKRNLVGAAILTVGTMFYWKFVISEPRKKRWADFYKSYDCQSDFQRMKDAGVFNSIK